MTSFPTHVGYGQHGALPHYVPRNASDLFIGRESTVVIDSGGQYESRYYHIVSTRFTFYETIYYSVMLKCELRIVLVMRSEL